MLFVSLICITLIRFVFFSATHNGDEGSEGGESGINV